MLQKRAVIKSRRHYGVFPHQKNATLSIFHFQQRYFFSAEKASINMIGLLFARGHFSNASSTRWCNGTLSRVSRQARRLYFLRFSTQKSFLFRYIILQRQRFSILGKGRRKITQKVKQYFAWQHRSCKNETVFKSFYFQAKVRARVGATSERAPAEFQHVS